MSDVARKAVTHEEVYRRFDGTLRVGGVRFWPIIGAGIRAGVKRKLPLIVLFAPIVIGTIVSSVGVYARYAAADAADQTGNIVAAVVSDQATNLLEARNLIIQYNGALSIFALFAAAWYGCGLLCEDRRVGAHQLYFARPITRLDYFLGKFGVVAFFGALGVIVPGAVMLFVAIYSAPGWRFFAEQGDLLWRSPLYGLIWITVVGSLTLCASSLFSRRSFALAGVIGFAMMLEAISHALGDMISPKWLGVSPIENLATIVNVVLASGAETRVDPAVSWSVLTGIVLTTWLVIAVRIRRLEVVA